MWLLPEFKAQQNDVPMFKIEGNMRKLCNLIIIFYNLMIIFSITFYAKSILIPL